MARARYLRGHWLLAAAAVVIAGCSGGGDSDSPSPTSTGDSEQSEIGAASTSTPAAADASTIVYRVETLPPGRSGRFEFTGVPTGTVGVDGTLIVTDLEPGTYVATEVDPAPDFDVSSISCDDQESPTASSGDASTRTAVVNLDPGEIVECTFTNTERGGVAITSEAEPAGDDAVFEFTGVPSGTIQSGGNLVVAQLEPGTYTSTQVDPAPGFDVTEIVCDDDDGPTASTGDPGTRTVVVNIDPGELVSCTFVNTRRATAIVAVETDPVGVDEAYEFTGVPFGTVEAGASLDVTGLVPGTYTTTMVKPEAGSEIRSVECDDADSASASSGDVDTRTALFNLDAGETTRCTFVVAVLGGPADDIAGGGGSGVDGEGPWDPDAVDPFADPDPASEPLPEPELEPEPLGSLVPRPGPWAVSNGPGSVDCGGFSLDIPIAPLDFGSIEVSDGGRTVVGIPTDPSESSVTVTAVPEIRGRYLGSMTFSEQGASFTFDFVWQVVTSEYIVGYMTAEFAQGGIACSMYRPYELWHDG